jgi:hypothetical protein
MIPYAGLTRTAGSTGLAPALVFPIEACAEIGIDPEVYWLDLVHVATESEGVELVSIGAEPDRQF